MRPQLHATPPSPAAWGPGVFSARGAWIAVSLIGYSVLFNIVRPYLASLEMGGQLINLLFLPVSIVAALLCWRVARSGDVSVAARRGWVLMGLANLAYWLGDVLWFSYELRYDVIPPISWADPFYLLQWPLLLSGILALLPRGGRSVSTRFWLDAFTVMISGWMVTWHLVLGPIAVTPGEDLVANVIALAYPVMDLVLFVGLSVLLVQNDLPVSRTALCSLMVGLLCLFAGDVGYGFLSMNDAYLTGTWPDGLWMFGQCLIALSAQMQYMHGQVPDYFDSPLWRRVARTRQQLLPYLAVFAAYAILFLTVSASGIAMGLLLGTVSVTAAVVLRQVLVLRENSHLATEVERSEARFRSLVQHSSDVIAVVDGDMQFRYVSPAIGPVLGHTPMDLVSRSLQDMVHPDDGAWAANMLAEGETRRVHCRLLHHDSIWIQAEITVNNLLGDPLVQGIVLNIRDVSERKALEDQLRFQAYHDSLTGLANRDLLRTRAARALAQQREHNRPLSVLFLDLDGFKTINDSLGHMEGDGVLKLVAARLLRCVRPQDTVARLGGDEFAVLLQGVGADDACAVAARIIRELQVPVPAGGKPVVVGGSVGIAVSQAGQESADELLRNADVAMYQAKEMGKGCYAIFEPIMHLAVMDRLNLVADLRRALEQEEFLLHYQPAVHLPSGRIHGVEALVRWKHPERGLVPPDHFIPLAEETGLIIPLGRWVLREACRQASEWQQQQGAGERPLRIGVNLSVRQLQDPHLVNDVREALRLYPLYPQTLLLEITESDLVEATEAIISTMEEIKELGVILAVDDFGTGYSSLSYLGRFPVDVVKIDRTFVSAMTGSARGLALMRGVVELVHVLGLDTVAEGVEEQAQLDLLQQMGCRFAQGWLLGRPAPASHLNPFPAKQVSAD
ncbi:MAG TPA: EAL domain-containing protein [Symbiobacteriaceae bacterium]|nr:EAL domain-containing protein [Symbiobacteriaceae bacterium]